MHFANIVHANQCVISLIRRVHRFFFSNYMLVKVAGLLTLSKTDDGKSAIFHCFKTTASMLVS